VPVQVVRKINADIYEVLRSLDFTPPTLEHLAGPR
jgi:hypothetical protein